MTYEQKKKKLVKELPYKDGLIIVEVNELRQILDDMARYVRSVMEVEEKLPCSNPCTCEDPTECIAEGGWNSARTTAQKQADDSGIPKGDRLITPCPVSSERNGFFAVSMAFIAVFTVLVLCRALLDIYD